MWLGARVGVIVPAYREARLLGRTLSSIPGYVDAIFVIDDASPDRTHEVALSHQDRRVRTIRHEINRGVGAAIATGYRCALDECCDVLAVMAGDNQMHPDDLAGLLRPVILGLTDYAKGNRFRHPEAHRMPLPRRWGGRFLSAATRWATGLDIDDSQCGFTVISSSAAQRVPLDELWPRFGYPNDLLGLLAARGLRVMDVTVRPIYADEDSGLRPWHVVTITGLIIRYWWRQRRAQVVPLGTDCAADDLLSPAE